MAHIVLCNLQNTNSQILPKKTTSGKLFTDYEQKKKKKRKKDRIKQNSKHFCMHLPEILGEFP